jgi:hypothetical protein
MPSVSKKQARFMAAAAHNPKFAKKAGIKPKVAKEFNQADAGTGILKKAMGGRVAGRGALTRIAPQVQKNPDLSNRPVMRNHMVDPVAVGAEADQSMADTGSGLRSLIGRVSGRMRPRIAASHGGKIERKAEGGKVGSAMSALRLLAKKYQEALDSGDTALARRLKRQLDSAGVEDPEEKVGNEKAATFAKGGKVKGIAKAIRARMDDLEGYVREGFGDTKEEAHENLRKEVAKDNGEDVVDALLKEHGVTYQRSKK